MADCGSDSVCRFCSQVNNSFLDHDQVAGSGSGKGRKLTVRVTQAMSGMAVLAELKLITI